MALSGFTEEEADRIKATVEMLRSACVEQGYEVTADDRIGEVEAAQLAGYQPRSFANLRLMHGGPAFYRRRTPNGSKISYRLQDLAIWVERARED